MVASFISHGMICTDSLNLLQVHLLPTETPSSVEDSKKPVAEHSSEVKSRAACNCGRVQSDKDDPFDHKVTHAFSWAAMLYSP